MKHKIFEGHFHKHLKPLLNIQKTTNKQTNKQTKKTATTTTIQLI